MQLDENIIASIIPSGRLWKSSSLQSDSRTAAESNHASSTPPISTKIENHRVDSRKSYTEKTKELDHRLKLKTDQLENLI